MSLGSPSTIGVPAIRVVFDTSALHTLTPRDPASLQLLNLVQQGRVEVFVPKIVRRELESQLLSSIHKGIERFAAGEWLSGANQEAFRVLRASLDGADLRAELAGNLTKWLQQLQATELVAAAADAEDVFDSYFKGQPPFGSPKNRQDLPDAFIFACVRRLAVSGTSPVHFVCVDKRLRRTSDALGTICGHETLQSFLGIPALRRPMDHYRSGVCSQYENMMFQLLEPSLRERLEGLDLVELEEPSAEYTGAIIAVEEFETVDFDCADGIPFDDDSIEIPFHCVAEVFADTADGESVMIWHADEVTTLRLRLHIEAWANVKWSLGAGGTLEPREASVRRIDSVRLAD
jgi:hypothetical protein